MGQRLAIHVSFRYSRLTIHLSTLVENKARISFCGSRSQHELSFIIADPILHTFIQTERPRCSHSYNADGGVGWGSSCLLRLTGPSMPRLEMLKDQHKLLLHLLPRVGVEEDVRAALKGGGLLDGLVVDVLGEPEVEILVVPPVSLVELLGGRFLHRIPRLRVEDKEERLVAERANLAGSRWRLNVVARG